MTELVEICKLMGGKDFVNHFSNDIVTITMSGRHPLNPSAMKKVAERKYSVISFRIYTIEQTEMTSITFDLKEREDW